MRKKIFFFRRLCVNYLEPLRRQLQRPVVINSGFRCPAVNAAVGGTPHSWHLQGCAVDIGCASPREAVDIMDFFRRQLPLLKGLSYEEMYYHPTPHRGGYIHFAADCRQEPLGVQQRCRSNYQLALAYAKKAYILPN